MIEVMMWGLQLCDVEVLLLRDHVLVGNCM